MKQFAWFYAICICSISNVLSKEVGILINCSVPICLILQKDVLSEKIQQLTDWSLKQPMIRLNNERFKYYVKTAPRNYSMVIMLAALAPQRKCGICK